MAKTTEWEVGTEIGGRGIYVRLKGYTDCKFSHNFITIEDAEQFAEHILSATKKLKELSSGKCIQCNEYISNNDIYYELEQDKKIHKYCLGNYAEENIIENKLIPKNAEKFDTRKIYFEHKENKES